MNTQLYENSPLAGASIEEVEKSNPDGFYNAKDPNLAILHERPEHRICIMLKASGKSNNEIAAIINYTPSWVSQILRQPWAKEALLRELKKLGGDSVAELLAGTATDSVFKLIQLRDTADDEGVQLRASQDLLDRYLGKATQKVESNTKVTHLSGDVEKVDKELAEIESQLLRALPTARPQTIIANN